MEFLTQFGSTSGCFSMLILAHMNVCPGSKYIAILDANLSYAEKKTKKAQILVLR